ncbi:MAG: DUF1540 domain-containing protein [Bacillota bacterium]
MATIKCKVEECTYYDNAMCTANTIEVMSTGDKRVASSDGTMCNTFKPANR